MADLGVHDPGSGRSRWAVFRTRVHRAGEKLFVDYSGVRPRIWDRETGEAIDGLEARAAVALELLEGPRVQAIEEDSHVQLDLDRPAMRPLPARRYELALWKRAGVGIDSHV